MVTTPIRLGLAGAHSTGKTTLARRIEMEIRATGLTVARTGGLAKRAAELGFPKMARHTAASTEWIIASGAAATLEAELHADIVIVDRTAYDALAYYLAALHHRGEVAAPDELDRLVTLARLHAHRQALIMATVLDPAARFTPPTGKDSDYPDTAFRSAVDQHLHQLLKDHHLNYVPVGRLDHAKAVQTAVTTVMESLETP
ncbi:AAA family ATPase [Microtetraspora sp. AC03309]|uniref:AAA family ATPase n=1 Tax=Microtetraspora sp. AC03309 TaxID=2779376 RepID=UPI001E3950A9|nr:AAA family ATPase [Microtetraspora sp. AC03309]MCC5574458.1 AAA family ATPase [Microtetraspora sp. AC03309]